MVTAETAAKAVIARATRGFCPWATAKEVITPAPNAAIPMALTQSFCTLCMDFRD